MFKQRFWTALSLIPLVCFGILYAPSWVLQSIVLAITVACFWEWSSLVPLTQQVARGAYVLIGLLCTLGLGWVFAPFCWFSLGLWGLLSWAIARYPQSSRYWAYNAVVLFLGILLLSVFAQSLIKLLSFGIEGRYWLLFLLCFVWACDTAAYIFGKCWGRRKLIPQVSPGKTVEGLFGAAVVAGLVFAAGIFLLTLPWIMMSYCLGLVLVALVGDLLISMLKRRVGLKDTGACLPGHGGILDRLDSLIATAPFFYALLLWLVI
ncbi:MAG: phosphatidate cytidylyltransferase [Legionellaceae bacterium]|nr:phosphatidate cytidylyltransferase [Legionellaceae bacterium]